MTNELLFLVGVENADYPGNAVTQQGWACLAPGQGPGNGPPGVVPDSFELLPLA